MEEIIKRKKTMQAQDQGSASVDPSNPNADSLNMNRARTMGPKSINFGAPLPEAPLETLPSEDDS